MLNGDYITLHKVIFADCSFYAIKISLSIIILEHFDCQVPGSSTLPHCLFFPITYISKHCGFEIGHCVIMETVL